jgi:uncharacterized repeat protein (TIGR02543 family)
MKNLYKFLRIAALAAIIGLVAIGCKMDDNDDNPATYTVTFVTNGGSPVAAIIDVASGAKITAPPASTKAGNSFAGWHKEASLITLWNFAVDTVSADATLYAKWTAIATYTVIYDGNGNTDGAAPSDANSPYETGATVTALDNTGNLEKTGHAFDGWNTRADGSGTGYAANATFTITGDTTLYAKWVGTTYTVTYDTDGGNPASQTRTVNDGASVGASYMPDEPTRSGYIFAGWYTGANGAGTQFTADTTVDGDIRVYAKWTTTYTVTYDANGGSPASLTRPVNDGASVGASNMPDDPTRSGHTFGGWYTGTNGAGTQFTATTTVNENITVYAKWAITTYRVIHNSDGGNPIFQTRTVNDGASVGASNMPDNPTRSGYIFGGWYTETNGAGTQFTADTTVTGDTTVYAKWTVANLSDLSSLAESLIWLADNAEEGGEYTITVSADETIASTIASRTLSYNGKRVSITLDGGEAERTVTLGSTGSLFTVGSGVTLTLGNNVTLQGRSSNTSLIQVDDGGALVMNTGSKVGNNTVTGPAYGSGVSVNGTFTMNGGTISDNTVTGSAYGGGVSVSGTFTMNGGEISGNRVSLSSGSAGGGGVYVSGGTFTMNGGAISGNEVSVSVSGNFITSYGGGVFVSDGTFTLTDGTISGNTASSSSTKFYISTASYGGGVAVSSGRFTMSGGTISRNTASSSDSSSGGGVFVQGKYVGATRVYGIFTMSGGTISGNRAFSSSYTPATSTHGGGVYISLVNGGATFTKQTGGVIYGSDASYELQNSTQGATGHAVLVVVYPGSQPDDRRYRNTTAGPDVTLDSSISGSAGGWR